MVAAAVLAATAAGIAGYLTTRGGSAVSRPPAITQTSIAGAKLGLAEAAYKKYFGPWKTFVLSEPGFPGLTFGQPQVSVFFPDPGQPAHIITTWNRTYRTAAGIGPCSMIAQMKKAYGAAVRPSWSGTSPDGKKVSQWAVGNNLIFATQDQKTLSAVALYKGDPGYTGGGSPQAYAGYVAAVESPCK